MVDTLVSGASASRRVGSTPIIRTQKKAQLLLGFFLCADDNLNPCHFVTSPFRGTPTSPFGRVGRHRCFDFLRKSR